MGSAEIKKNMRKKILFVPPNEKKCPKNRKTLSKRIYRTLSCGCGSAAAVRGQTAGILTKSHKVKKIWKKIQQMREYGVKKAKLFHRREDLIFLMCLGFFNVGVLHYFLNSVRRIKKSNLFSQDFSYIWNEPGFKILLVT